MKMYFLLENEDFPASPKKKTKNKIIEALNEGFPPSYRQSHHHHYRSPSCERVLDGFKIQGLHPWQSMAGTLKLTPWTLDMVSIPCDDWQFEPPKNNSWGLASSGFQTSNIHPHKVWLKDFGRLGVEQEYHHLNHVGIFTRNFSGRDKWWTNPQKIVGNHPSTPSKFNIEPARGDF